MNARLREVSIGDAASICAIYGPFVEHTPVSFESVAPTEAEMQLRIERTTERHPWLVAVSDDGVLGYAYAVPHRVRPAYQWSVETSIYLAPKARRKGLARRLYGALFSMLEIQGYGMAYAGVTLPNPDSVGFHESMGFEPVGVFHSVGNKHGAWHDVGWWQREISSLGPTPDRPRSPAALRDSAAWKSALGE